MKKVIVALALMLGVSLSTFAQDYSVKRGYKGVFEGGYTTIVSGFNSGKIELSTSHGYQFNPYLFVGAGFGVECYTQSLYFVMPVFANVKVTPLKGNITPFVDLKGGYSIIGYFEGLYLSPTIGCRFGLTRRVGLNVGIGYTLQQTNTKYYEWDPLDKLENKTINFHGLSFKFGFDF
jgi:hypothetical protein